MQWSYAVVNKSVGCFTTKISKSFENAILFAMPFYNANEFTLIVFIHILIYIKFHAIRKQQNNLQETFVQETFGAKQSAKYFSFEDQPPTDLFINILYKYIHKHCN